VRKITLDLSTRDINRAIRDLKRYKRELNKKVSLLIKTLTDYGVDVAKAQIRELGAWYTGELESSITGYFSPTVGAGVIKAGSPYAVFVEFGTGVVGERSPHPQANTLWTYNTPSEHKDETGGWWYYNDRDNRLHYTHGIESRPFMYNTARELEMECMRIAKEVFAR
jgi:hypothetical protein